MLFVKTKIGPSTIHGTGLFADEFIPKGTVIWKFTPGFDQRLTREQILSLPDLAQIYIYKYSYKSKKTGLYCLATDNDKYCNHSDDSNTLSAYIDGEEEVVNTAIKDIQKGEEMTDNYSTFEYDTDDANVLDEIAKKFNLGDELDPRDKAKL